MSAWDVGYIVVCGGLYLLILWNGIRISIGNVVCFEVYPAKRFFRKDGGKE